MPNPPPEGGAPSRSLAERHPAVPVFAARDNAAAPSLSSGAKHWRCPVALGLFGIGDCLAAIWQRCPSASSVLPVLALGTWPGRREDALAREEIPPPSGTTAAQWTTWAECGHAWIAERAGLSRKTVGVALHALEALGLVQLHQGPLPTAGAKGRSLTYYRLRVDVLYPRAGEPFTRVPEALITSGAWAALPSNAARHLFLVLACCDPVRSEEGLAAAMDRAPDDDAVALACDRARRKHLLTYSRLEHVSGLRASTLQEARRVLLAPLAPPGEALIATSEVDPGAWYAPNRRALAALRPATPARDAAA
jgi:hypothetical protein